MEREKIAEDIRKIVISVLKHDQFIFTNELSAKDVKGWDSLNHMVIITDIEKHFVVKFKLRELNKLNNIGNLIELVQVKLSQ